MRRLRPEKLHVHWFISMTRTPGISVWNPGVPPGEPKGKGKHLPQDVLFGKHGIIKP